MVNNYFSSIFIFLILLPEILNSTIEEFRNSFKEVAYSYYMRGKSIQWCVARDHFFSPEESTEQNANYIVTTSFTSIVYEELLNVVVPYSPSSLFLTFLLSFSLYSYFISKEINLFIFKFFIF